MDNLTHSLIGATVANAGLKQKLGRGTTLALIVASNITDIDIFGFCLHEGPSFLYRRMWTHSILGMPVLSVLFGFLFGRLYPNLGFKKAFGIFLLGTALHVLFDLMNSYGVVLLHPFSHERFELGWLFIIDLAIWGMLLLPLLLAINPTVRSHLMRVSQIAAGTLAIYVFACGALWWRAAHHLKKISEPNHGDVTFTYVFPEALGPHRFRGVVRRGDQYSVFMIYPLSNRHEFLSQTETVEGSPEVQQILETKRAQDLLWFAKAPVWERVGTTNVWQVYDLRFASIVTGRPNHFAYRFRVSQNGVEFLGR